LLYKYNGRGNAKRPVTKCAFIAYPAAENAFENYNLLLTGLPVKVIIMVMSAAALLHIPQRAAYARLRLAVVH
jgi:hypothetical protein